MATSTTPHTLRAAIGPTHPVYDLWDAVWQRLAHVAEGSGGFLDGTYLVAHPREWKDHDKDSPSEPTKKLLERRTLARYDNLAAIILDQKQAALFREPPLRRFLTPDGTVVEGHPYLAWTEDVDGAGTSLDVFWRDAWKLAATFGHVFIVMDRAADAGPTAADASPLVLRVYTPLDVPDWLQAPNGQVTAIKVIEPVLRTSLAESPDTIGLQYKVTEITDQTARSYTTLDRGNVTEAAHRFGALPVVVLYAHRRAMIPLIGQSALSDPQLFIDLYNLVSEQRELLRKQTFSILNIPLGTSPDGGTAMRLEDAQAMLGASTGTANVLFTAQEAQYVTAETNNVTVYAETIAALIRLIFRLCAVPYDQDSREAETAEARRLKRADFTTALAGYADELTAAERSVAELWFRGTYGDTWQAEWERAGLTVSYPRQFEDAPFSEVIAQAQAALSLPLGESKTFRIQHAEKLIPRFIPDATPDVQDAIRTELEALPTPEEQRQERLELMAARVTAMPARRPPQDSSNEAA